MKVFGLFALLAATTSCASPLESTNVSPSTNPQSPAHLSPRDGYPDIYQFNITLIEQCSDGELVALSWARGQHLNFGKDPGEGHHQMFDVELGTYNITIGPYSYAQHSVLLQVDGCKWTSDGRALGIFVYWPCGWCVEVPWTGEPLDCAAAGANELGRFTHRTCYYLREHVQGVGRRDERVKTPAKNHMSPRSVVQVTQVVTLTALPSPVDDITIDPATLTATPGPRIPKIYDPSSPDVQDDPEDDPESDPESDPEGDPFTLEPASTQTLYPQILPTTLPSSFHNQPSTIFPFNISLSEYCGSHGEHLATGVYANGNIRRSLDLSFEVVLGIKHHIPGYASDLVIGPLDSASHVLHLAYQDCEWADQRNQSCAQCVVAHEWISPVLDCAETDGGCWRELQCWVVLGTQPGINVKPAKPVINACGA